MSPPKRKPQTPTRPPAPLPRNARRRNAHVANPLVQPDARWQRGQRYVWDKKRG